MSSNSSSSQIAMGLLAGILTLLGFGSIITSITDSTNSIQKTAVSIKNTAVSGLYTSFPGSFDTQNTAIAGLNTSFPQINTAFPQISTIFPMTSTPFPGVNTMFPAVSTAFPAISSRIPGNNTSSINATLIPTATLSPSATSARAGAQISLVTPARAASIGPVINLTQVAVLPIIVRSFSGLEIGRGTLQLYAPAKVTFGQTATVELEIYFDSIAMTPTPIGGITLVPALTRVASPFSAPPLASSTPRILRTQITGLRIFELMGAALNCASSSFKGCDSAADIQKSQYVRSGEPVRWRWILAPEKDAKGPQELSVELWTVYKLDNGVDERRQTEWQNAFSIEIEPSDDFVKSNSGPLIGLFGSIIVAMIGAVGYFINNRGKDSKQEDEANVAQQSKVKPTKVKGQVKKS